MPILIQHNVTKLFLKGVAEWTANGEQALRFPDADTAHNFARYQFDGEVEVVNYGRTKMVLPLLPSAPAKSGVRSTLTPSMVGSPSRMQKRVDESDLVWKL